MSGRREGGKEGGGAGRPVTQPCLFRAERLAGSPIPLTDSPLPASYSCGCSPGPHVLPLPPTPRTEAPIWVCLWEESQQIIPCWAPALGVQRCSGWRHLGAEPRKAAGLYTIGVAKTMSETPARYPMSCPPLITTPSLCSSHAPWMTMRCSYLSKDVLPLHFFLAPSLASFRSFLTRSLP